MFAAIRYACFFLPSMQNFPQNILTEVDSVDQTKSLWNSFPPIWQSHQATPTGPIHKTPRWGQTPKLSGENGNEKVELEDGSSRPRDTTVFFFSITGFCYANVACVFLWGNGKNWLQECCLFQHNLVVGWIMITESLSEKTGVFHILKKFQGTKNDSSHFESAGLGREIGIWKRSLWFAGCPTTPSWSSFRIRKTLKGWPSCSVFLPPMKSTLAEKW